MTFRRKVCLLVLGTVVFALPTVWVISAPAGVSQSQEPKPWDCLVLIARAQDEFLKRDGDRNGRSDYWRGDVAGLSRALEVQGRAGRVWGRSIAAADERRVTRRVNQPPVALGGYFFRSIRHGNEASYSSTRYAIAAFPASYSESCRVTYIISEMGTVWEKDTGPGGIEIFPVRPANEGWKRR